MIDSGLAQGKGVRLIVNAYHRALLQNCLAAAGLHLQAAQQQSHLEYLDAGPSLAQVMAGGTRPNPRIFYKMIAPVLSRLASQHARIKVYGERVDLLMHQYHNPHAILVLKNYWKHFMAKHVLFLLLSYSLDGASLESTRQAYLNIRQKKLHLQSRVNSF